jgi:hypothetical protein
MYRQFLREKRAAYLDDFVLLRGGVRGGDIKQLVQPSCDVIALETCRIIDGTSILCTADAIGSCS